MERQSPNLSPTNAPVLDHSCHPLSNLYAKVSHLREELSPSADQGRIETHFRTEDSSLQVWYDNHDPRLSEAACARFDDMVSCKTRILPENPQTRGRSSHRSRLNKGVATVNGVPVGYDLMVIMLDPMSRSHLQRSMPQTIAILRELEFLQFSKYSAVGDNSGPNQAALYSGKPLSDRNGCGTHCAKRGMLP